MPPKVSRQNSKSGDDRTTVALVTPATMHPKLIWLYGSTGSGKTYYIHTRYPNAFVKFADCNWKGYKGEDTVAIEDFNLTIRKTFQLSFLQWLTNDYIPVYVQPYKKKCIRPKTFLVTSYYHPTDFKHLKPFMKQFLSNCEIIHCTFISALPPPVKEIIVDTSAFESAPPSSDSEDYPLTQANPDEDGSDDSQCS